MTTVSMDLVRELREKTQVGLMDCKKALAQAEGDFNQAVQILKKRGLAAAEKKAQRQATQGMIFSYIHMGGKIGVLVEINCETDFVARNKQFQDLAKEVALQIAGTHPTPLYVSKDDLKDSDHARIQDEFQGKPEKYYEQVCLLDQPYIKDSSIKMSQLVQSKIAELGENIVIRRFVRYQLGEMASAS